MINKKDNKHPVNFDGYTPKDFADKFVKTNYFYQEKVFEELVKRYSFEAEGDKKRKSIKNPEEKRVQLSSGLEKISEAIRGPVLDSMKNVLKACKNYLINPYKETSPKI